MGKGSRLSLPMGSNHQVRLRFDGEGKKSTCPLHLFLGLFENIKENIKNTKDFSAVHT